MSRFPRLDELPPSAFALVASNLVPLAGVLLLGWDLGLVLLLYWAESGVILLFSLLKMAETAGLAAFFLVPFFIVHAGGFMAAHLVFLLVLFVHPGGGWGPLLRDVGLGVLAFLLSHGYSYVANHRRKGEAYGKPQDVMGAFYGRIMVMQVTIIFGGWLVLLIGKPVGALVVLVLVKTGIDLAAHLRERRKRAPPTPVAGAGDGTGPTSPS